LRMRGAGLGHGARRARAPALAGAFLPGEPADDGGRDRSRDRVPGLRAFPGACPASGRAALSCARNFSAGAHAMEYRSLGASGLKVPALSMGTATFGGANEFFAAWGATDVDGARRLVDVCLDAGVIMFDSADVYSDGLAESNLGRAIAGRRDKVLVSTK